jgi:hypothetical protein
MSETQKTKNQHYVPQGYLEQFTYDGKHLFVFDKSSRRVYRTHTKNVASERYFYDFDPGTQQNFTDTQVVEHILSEREANFYNCRDELLKTIEETSRITLEQKQAMAYFIALQLARTPEYRRNSVEFVNKVGDYIAQLTPDILGMPDTIKRDYEFSLNLSESEIARFHAGMMFPPDMLSDFVKVLDNHIWTIGINRTEHRFYTSDTPVVMKAHSARRAGIGVATPGIEIVFPLTQRCVLILWERSFFIEKEKQDCQTKQLTDDEVRYYNSLQALRSYQRVFCASADFFIAEKLCERFLDICNLDRAKQLSRLVPHADKTLVHVTYLDPDRTRFEIH